MLKSYRLSMIVLFAGTCASALLVGSIGAQASSINFENFNYSGSVTRYGSAADALADTNPSGPYVIGTATNGSLSTLPNARAGWRRIAASAAAPRAGRPVLTGP